MRVALRATLRILTSNKSSVAKVAVTTWSFQQQGVLPADYDFKFEDDIRIDQIVEFGDLVSRKIWESELIASKLNGRKTKNCLNYPIWSVHEIASSGISPSTCPTWEIQQINEAWKS